MATTNNSKSFFDLPVTTQLVYLILTLLGFGFLLILNPITLFVLNIIKPRWANDFAHSDELYSERCQKFFTWQAKKWPWLWAKWWYTSKEIGCLTDDKQLDYYYNVSHSIETLNAMSIHNSAKVIGKDFEGFKEYIASVNTLNAMSTAISAKDAYINMSYNLFCAFIRASIEKDDMSALGDYLKRGTLPKDQVKILSEYASDSTSGVYSNTWLALVFYDYVERCGLGQDLLKTLFERPNSAHFKKEVERRQNIYSQRVFTKSQRGTKQTDAWLAFCETTKEICPQAQMEMGLDQYHVFHKTGHTLDAEAILHILSHNSDRMMAQLIFEYEPNYGIVSDDIKEFLDKNLVLRSLRDSVIENHPDDLQRRIYGNEKLTEEELSKVFDYPNAGQLIFNYVTRYPLPENLHKRMLELPERAHACILMYYHNEVSPQEWCLGKFHLADDVRREAIKRGWIREKKK
mgnify:CR=1 FL=1